ncbi:Por secretion system C-terminal sorting domain-containing protein [Chryseobacterium soldanellicola]|uniref:Por secretion system C-terminal sorting domain-containing protein n=1 Tax=Chryseobacterium soldanellicola TaxID=311333 RepID=A0A1H1E477_9FLAO|nr:zinc-dependent metalloprotease family protein [Chryseobacterium soldanellicola]SDQ83308.1 Por secretion system C-terminal sorting domain-containing protein [Chryseobacterium soldanellicola]
MKKIITVFLCSFGVSAFAQWTPATFQRKSTEEFTQVRGYYKLDLNKIREQLKNAQETGPNSKSVEISLPTLNGKIEKFAVYSFPVVVKELADQYQLGSYVGVGIDDPTKYLRFSVAPNDFQSMIIKDGSYEFIEPQNADKTVYGVHPRTNNRKEGFVCSTKENALSKAEIKKLYENGKSFVNQPTNFAKSSDKKYRTMRLALSVTGEYTAFHGGTVAGALAAMNATMTRVNGVYEKDFALHLNIQNFPGIIYTNAATDPYSGNLNLELQQNLTTNVGDANYDIGHLFNAAGNDGNAGCIGCICTNPTTAEPEGKGSGFTQTGAPQGDYFDIDFVSHEMGHQIGAEHTHSFRLEGGTIQMEPGSGSTIMGYAGITGPNTDVQPHSDAYFHTANIVQVQANLTSTTCDVETPITNNPPVITALPTYNIPKGTAFVLTASATDPENDPMTYTWEEVDNTSVIINKNNLGTTATGASFRSFTPTTNPTRYFPMLSSVMNGVLNNSGNTWESVSMVPRTTKFAVTVRDNNPTANQQQTQYAEQTIVVGNNGPFKINTQYATHTVPTIIDWDAAGTTAAPYSVANVKIDYTTDNGTTWTVVSASTANDGSENITLPASLNNQTIKLRISAIGNVFYAVKSISISTFAVCDGTAPTGVAVTGITATDATVNWAPISGATYIIRYKKLTDTTWQQTTSTSPTVTLSGLTAATAYEVQVAAVCSGTPGTYSASTNFTTLGLTYCAVASANATDDYIANVTLANINNSSSASTYTSYVANSALQINLIKGSGYTLTVTKGWLSGTGPYPEAISAWIDFNRNGTFEDAEIILTSPVTTASSTPATANFTVPATAVTDLGLRMRVGMLYATQTGVGITNPCGTYNTYGEFEDYNVVVSDVLGTNDLSSAQDGIQLYPNPASDVLNITKVSDKASYKIYSAAGQLVGNGTVSGGKINVSSLIKGVYMITIDDKGKATFNSKFIKK